MEMPCILNTYLVHFGCWTTQTLKLITFFLLPKQSNSRVFTPDCLGKSLQPDLLNWLECTWEDSHFCCKTDVCVMVVEVIHDVWALVNKSASAGGLLSCFFGGMKNRNVTREKQEQAQGLSGCLISMMVHLRSLSFNISLLLLVWNSD